MHHSASSSSTAQRSPGLLESQHNSQASGNATPMLPRLRSGPPRARSTPGLQDWIQRPPSRWADTTWGEQNAPWFRQYQKTKLHTTQRLCAVTGHRKRFTPEACWSWPLNQVFSDAPVRDRPGRLRMEQYKETFTAHREEVQHDSDVAEYFQSTLAEVNRLRAKCEDEGDGQNPKLERRLKELEASLDRLQKYQDAISRRLHLADEHLHDVRKQHSYDGHLSNCVAKQLAKRRARADSAPHVAGGSAPDHGYSERRNSGTRRGSRDSAFPPAQKASAILEPIHMSEDHATWLREQLQLEVGSDASERLRELLVEVDKGCGLPDDTEARTASPQSSLLNRDKSNRPSSRRSVKIEDKPECLSNAIPAEVLTGDTFEESKTDVAALEDQPLTEASKAEESVPSAEAPSTEANSPVLQALDEQDPILDPPNVESPTDIVASAEVPLGMEEAASQLNADSSPAEEPAAEASKPDAEPAELPNTQEALMQETPKEEPDMGEEAEAEAPKEDAAIPEETSQVKASAALGESPEATLAGEASAEDAQKREDQGIEKQADSDAQKEETEVPGGAPAAVEEQAEVPSAEEAHAEPEAPTAEPSAAVAEAEATAAEA